MRSLIGCNRRMKLAVLVSILVSTPVWAQEQNASPDSWAPPNIYFTYAVVVFVMFGALLILASIRAALSTSTWSLADALSEEVQVTEMEEQSGIATPKLGADGKPLMVTKMCASSSRLIALMGMMVILLMFLGFGVFVLFSFGQRGIVPDSIGNVVHFLLAGLALFAPYTVNKFASLFESFSPKKE